MNPDWKDTLAALRGNLDLPQEDSNESPEDNTAEENSQKTPLSVVIDRKGRNGKTATIIEGFSIDPKKVAEIARKLKQKLGVGGSVRDNEILIQGDHKESVKNFLISLNFKVK